MDAKPVFGRIVVPLGGGKYRIATNDYSLKEGQLVELSYRRNSRLANLVTVTSIGGIDSRGKALYTVTMVRASVTPHAREQQGGKQREEGKPVAAIWTKHGALWVVCSDSADHKAGDVIEVTKSSGAKDRVTIIDKVAEDERKRGWLYTVRVETRGRSSRRRGTFGGAFGSYQKELRCEYCANSQRNGGDCPEGGPTGCQRFSPKKTEAPPPATCGGPFGDRGELLAAACDGCGEHLFKSDDDSAVAFVAIGPHGYSQGRYCIKCVSLK